MMEAGYLRLFRSGELETRATALEERLSRCDICPRECHVDRLENRTGFCHSGRFPIISSVCAHHGEEPALSGRRGSGTVFFGNCTMRCVYCQNYQISQQWQEQKGKETTTRFLARQMLYLQDDLGCHNINLVSPTHFVPQIVRALVEAASMGLRIPLVYNTSGYDSVATIRELDGVVDIYLPDLKYASDRWAKEFSHTADYVDNARAAIKVMYKQVGNVKLDESGVARRGLIIRHLVLPNALAGSEESLAWLARELSPSVTVSLMAQYTPAHRAQQVPALARPVTPAEYNAAVRALGDLGMENGWTQELDARHHYVPDFHREGQPFTPRPT